MRRLAEFAATTAGRLSRTLGRGGGTTLPGNVLLRLRPDALAEYAADLERGCVLVSATNGKTTTSHLIATACRAAGYALVTNTEGSNLERGVVAAFLQPGAKSADLGLFEVDEAALPAVARATQPSVVVLMNLFRDQLDRYGELETLIDLWRDMLDELEQTARPPTLVLNADDPNIAALGVDRSDVVWFGMDDVTQGVAERAHAADATTCRNCGSALVHSFVALGHLGHWHCSNCSRTRPTPTISVTKVTLGGHGQTVQIVYPGADAASASGAETLVVESPLPGLHNAYNIAAATAASFALAGRNGQPFDAATVGQAMAATQPAFGRGETVAIGTQRIQLLLAKNPTGVNQNIRTILSEPGPLHVLVMLNDRTADGQDVSWIWDVDWEPLQQRLASLTLGGDRAWDLALRFRYGGFDMDLVTVKETPDAALDTALRNLGAGETLHALPTYTALLDLRGLLTERGHTSAYWEKQR